jgi:outer membrane receptor protein involved in Fe transport
MKRVVKHFFIAVLLSFPMILSAENDEQTDSLRIIHLEEVKIYSHKETMSQQMPVSSTVITPNVINGAQMHSIRDLSVFVPNFFIPDYGSAMSTAPYIRGIGSRSTGQSMALYVDNVPYFEKSTFDFDFYDIRQIEILRGPQGTLYGRNALGGIVNIYTLSPFDYQGTKLSVTGGNYGLAKVQAAHYDKVNKELAWSVSGYCNHIDGFFTNLYNNKKADDKTSAGGRAKIEWFIRPNFRTQYIFNYDYVDQTAYPYGLYEPSTGTAQPNYNDDNNYSRSMVNNSLMLEYTNDKIQLTSSTSHQYFSDDMKMDQDFLPKSYFSLNQHQKQQAFNEEIALRSKTASNYQWSFGLTSFIQYLDTDAPVAFKKDGITDILQPVFDRAAAAGAPTMTITDSVMDIPGTYDTKTWGSALFHQSTYNHLFVDGLSITAGLRANFEKTNLDYFTNAKLNLKMVMGPRTIPYPLADTLQGKESMKFSEILPKIALKYTWNDQQFVYATVSKGYKTGGFNIQMFADLMQAQLMSAGNPTAPKINVADAIAYQPEHSMNYEIGFQTALMDNRLKTYLAFFYMDISDMQLTQFVPSGQGRMITNAGEVTSKGMELSLQTYLGKGFNLDVNYGYAHATFDNYTDSVKVGNNVEEANYKGNFVPYAPQNTLSLNGNYTHLFSNAFIDYITACIQYMGTGKIYWNEANSLYQKFYHTVNAKIGIVKNNFEVAIWGKNLLNTTYNAFYFESFGNQFFQKGKPLQWGLTLKVEL